MGYARRLALLRTDPVPVGELSDFGHWPFRSVVGVRSNGWMKRNHHGRYYEPDPWPGSNSIIDLPHAVFGSWAVGTPISFQIYTPDLQGPFYLFRDWSWCWRLNWPMKDEAWDMFFPEPRIRHGVVEDFLNAVKAAGLYYPHKRDKRWFPRTWRDKEPLPHTIFLGDIGDQRFAGDETGPMFLDREAARRLQEGIQRRYRWRR